MQASESVADLIQKPVLELEGAMLFVATVNVGDGVAELEAVVWCDVMWCCACAIEQRTRSLARITWPDIRKVSSDL